MIDDDKVDEVQGRVTKLVPPPPLSRPSIIIDQFRSPTHMTCLSARLPCVMLIKVTLMQRKREAGQSRCIIIMIRLM